MKKIITTILLATAFPIYAFATVKITPDKPVEPDFVCKTEADIPSARAQALVRGGGPDFADSAEALCRSQIKASTPSSVTNVYQSNYTPTPKVDLDTYMQGFCTLHLNGSKWNPSKHSCDCPANNVEVLKYEDSQGNPYAECKEVKIDIIPVQPALSTRVTEVAPKQVLTKTLKLGDKGDDVKILQNKLGVEQTGTYGPKTKKAVQDFQKANKILQTGNVGPVTLKALNEKN